MTWEKIDSLPLGHYGVGLVDGEEIDIYRSGPANVMNVATGLPVTVTQWQRFDQRSPRFFPAARLLL